MTQLKLCLGTIVELPSFFEESNFGAFIPETNLLYLLSDKFEQDLSDVPYLKTLYEEFRLNVNKRFQPFKIN